FLSDVSGLQSFFYFMNDVLNGISAISTSGGIGGMFDYHPVCHSLMFRLLTKLLQSRLGKPGSISALVLPSGNIAARHRKGVTAERLSHLQDPVRPNRNFMLTNQPIEIAFDYPCLRSIGLIWWRSRTSDVGIRQMVLNRRTPAMNDLITLHWVLLQDRVGLSPNLMPAGEPTELVDKFVYMDSFIGPGSLIKDDIFIRIGLL
ncbi:hypothetical protein CSKR_200505, partial [Clonorchis sinensis]